MVAWARLRAVLAQVARAWGVFAVCHALFKVWRRVMLVARANRLLGHLPGAKFGLLQFDWLGRSQTSNLLTYYDYRSRYVTDHAGAAVTCGEGPFVEVFVNDRAGIKHVLKDDFNAFTKPAAGRDFLFELLGRFIGKNGIFVLSHGTGLGQARLEAAHARWYSQRKTASKIFTKSAFSNLMMETFLDKGAIMRATLLRDAGREVDFQKLSFNFTFDSISRIFFGRAVDTVSGRDTDAYAQAYDNAHRAMVNIYLKYATAWVSAQEALPFPLGTLGTEESSFSLAMWAVLRFSPEGRDFARQCEVLQRGTREILAQAKVDPKLAQRRDLLANFLNSGEELTDQDYCDIILNFIIAGRDTTACTLSWLVFELACNPDAQARAKAEVDRVLQGREPTYELVNQMPYLSACMQEALRLHPPVPEDFKVCSRDSTLPDGTRVPAGTKVSYSNYGLARSTALYTDPRAFKPERWIDTAGGLIELDEYQQPIFQSGNRICLGAAMARTEVRALISQLLMADQHSTGVKFTISDREKSNVSWALMITMSISNAADKNSHQLLVTPQPW
jgi:cytochrome P450